MAEKTIHQGRNIKRFREMFGIKQEAMALELGDDWNQKKISLLEAKETVDRHLLEQIAQVLKLPTEVFENYTDEAAVNYFNTFNDSSFSNSNGAFSPQNCTFNAYEEWKQGLNEIKQLQEDNKKLYEALIKEKDEKILLLEKLLEKK